MPSFFASTSTPPWPKMWASWPHCGQMYWLIFSIIPNTGVCNVENMSKAFRASKRATSCGVDTTIAPVSSVFWHKVNCTSPVPGGKSITKTSNSPHCTWLSICCNAPINIGPRHTTALSGSTIRPIDIMVTPWACNGIITLPSGLAGRLLTPIIRGWLGP